MKDLNDAGLHFADARHVAIVGAAQAACLRVAPAWALDRFVAVNPYFGLADQPFDIAAETAAAATGARATPPRARFFEALQDGRLTREDVAAALAEQTGPHPFPSDVDAFLAHAREAAEPSYAPRPTAADVASALDGRDWAGVARERVSGFAADWFDQGQAQWGLARDGDGLYATWLREARLDPTPEILGLTGLRAAFAAAPDTAEAALSAAARRLAFSPEDAVERFHRLLATIGGWAAYARGLAWDAELRGHNSTAPLELLAVRATWDAALHEIFERKTGFGAAWAAARANGGGSPAFAEAFAVDAVLQDAHEHAWRRRLRGSVGSQATPRAAVDRPSAQAVFCIDVRSEVFRRAFEAAAPRAETLGFAGFFGFAVDLEPFAGGCATPHAPALLAPAAKARETLDGATSDAALAEKSRVLSRRGAARAWKTFSRSASSSFAFVEAVGLSYVGKLIGASAGWTRPTPDPRLVGVAPEARLTAVVEDPSALIDAAEGALRGMSLTTNFARVVALVGHGGSTVNNPHARGLDCGACGGQSGGPSAQIAVLVLNDRAVRDGLRARGIDIPADTIFVAAQHDTTTDAVTIFDEAAPPASHAADIAALRVAFDAAGVAARAERASGLALDPSLPAEPQIFARARDWSQVRPEWALAGCAAFIVAPRSRTAGLDFGGHAFLHSYDHASDAGYAVLEVVMTAPMVVASWINLQYYASSVAPRVFGSGDKTLHDVVGGVGVFEGVGGDLRIGLPEQSVSDGETWRHEPLRLSVVIDAPISAIDGVIANHAHVRDLVDNGWIKLFALDARGRMAVRRVAGGGWAPLDDAEARQAA